MSSFELSPGVVVDTDRGEAYLMNPKGGIVAIDLTEGREKWSSQEASKPLAIADSLLLGQAEPAAAGNALQIVALDPREGGARRTESIVELPPGVQPLIDQTLERSFTAHAQPLAGAADVSWEFVERPVRGVAPGPFEVLPGEAPPEAFAAPSAQPMAAPSEPGETIVMRGAARVVLPGGTVTATEASPSALATAPTPTAPDLPADQRLPGVVGPQFLSADGKHVLSSRRVGDDRVWDKYEWLIFDRSSAQRLGKIQTHVRYAPFFVAGGRVIYQLPPTIRRVGGDIVEEPLQIRAADLSSGAPVWKQPVRDTSDHEPPPP
jgi:hypothetical protein